MSRGKIIAALTFLPKKALGHCDGIYEKKDSFATDHTEKSESEVIIFPLITGEPVIKSGQETRPLGFNSVLPFREQIG